MKARFKKRGIRSLIVLLLVSTMVCASACSGFFISNSGKKSPGQSAPDGAISGVKQVNSDKSDLLDNLNMDLVTKQNDTLSENDYVNYFVDISNTSLFTMFQQSAKQGETYQQYISTRDAKIQAENMTKMHKAIFNQIKKEMDVEFLTSYTGAINSFAVTIKFGDRDKLSELAQKYGAMSVGISERYEMPTYTAVENSVAIHKNTGIFERPEDFDYEGQGMLVAVLDSGLDYEHPAFSDNNLPTDGTPLKLTKDKLATVMPELTANEYTKNLQVNELYVNDKIPFMYDYGDFKPEVNTAEHKAHGTHVAGIIVGRANDPVKEKDGTILYEEDGVTKSTFEGVVPLAQLVFMKVFSDHKMGADNVAIFSAIEDCLTLNVDVVNMSLGLGSGYTDVADALDASGEARTQKAYEALNAAGINLVTAAGNGFSAPFGGHWGSNLASNPDSGCVGSPSTYYQSYSVASINGSPSTYITAFASGKEDSVAYINESGKVSGERRNFITELRAAIAEKDLEDIYIKANNVIEIPYVPVYGVGKDTDYVGLNVDNKIALISRGEITFTEKLEIAKRKGAIAAIVYNNIAGTISMVVEDKVNLPSCTITMDAASRIKSQLGNGSFRIDEKQGAGPFMSDFSSWGPTPSLEIKPEITGHGGEIYSSYPGGNYDRVSGTSMATPNIAGLTVITRQHIIAEANKAIAQNSTNDRYGVVVRNGLNQAVIDYTKVEARVYHLMMSTTTLPKDEFNNPYSPRKMGAGLANINAMLNTDAYLYVKDGDEMKDRTKLELFDDAYRKDTFGKDNFESGVYNMEFWVKNLTNSEKQYRLKAFTMTETMSSDEKTVAQISYMLNPALTWTVDGVDVTSSAIAVIPADKTDVKIQLKVKLNPTEIKYITDTFENGMFVEGFVRLDAVDTTVKGAENLGIPYLAFFGNWADGPMFDYTIYETDLDDKDKGLNEDDKRFSQNRPQMGIAKFTTEEGGDFVLPMGQFVFKPAEPYEDEVPYSTVDKTILSLSREAIFEFYYMSGFLRGAKTASWTIRNKHTGEVMKKSENILNSRKDAMSANMGGIKMEFRPAEMGCVNGATYVASFVAELDYYQYEGTETVKEWDFEFTIDTDAPIITNTEIRVEKDFQGNYRRYLDFYIHDDNYTQSMTFNIFNKDSEQYESIWKEGVRPIQSSKNSITKVTYDLTNQWDYIAANDYLISTKIYDYGFNYSSYDIKLDEVLNTGASKYMFADVGTYRNYSASGKSDIKVLTSVPDSPAIDSSMPSMTNINIVKNQSVKLNNILVVEPVNVWAEDLVWSTNNESAVRIDTKTGEIFANASGTATITVQSKADSSKRAQLTVNVLSDTVVGEYHVATVSEGRTALAGAQITNTLGKPIAKTISDRGYIFKAGEEFDIQVNALPWFSSTAGLTVNWSVTDSRIATITQNPDNPFQATIKAATGIYEYDENTGKTTYTTNRDNWTYVNVTIKGPDSSAAAMMAIDVLKEFVVEAGVLKEYNGANPEVIIPSDLDINTIGQNCFVNNNYVTKVTVPEGVHTIGASAFAYMTKLKEVYLPSTIKFIDTWAFSVYASARKGITTSLQILDTTKFVEPIHVEKRAFTGNQCLGTNGVFVGSVYSPSPTGGMQLKDSKFVTTKFRIIGEAALANLVFLTKLDLKGVRSVGKNAMLGVGSQAMEYFAKPTEILFDERTRLGDATLGGTGVEELNLPMSRIPAYSFLSNKFLKKINFTGENLVVEDFAFAGSLLLEEVVFEGSVDYIGGISFGYFTSEANIESNKEYWPVNLHTVDFQSTVRYIADYAFFGASGLQELKLPLGLEYLGTDAFRFSGIETLIIPEDFTGSIENFGSLFDTVNFTKLEIEDTNEDSVIVSEYVIRQLEGTKDVLLRKLDTTGTTFELVLIPYATELTTLNLSLHTDIKSIGDSAFGANNKLEEVNLGAVEHIGYGAMQNMKNLTKVTWSTGINTIPESMFYNCEKLTTIDGLERIVSIGAYAFTSTAITGITLPNTVTSIGAYAFADTQLTEFTVPTGVTELARYVLSGTKELTHINSHIDLVKVDDGAFARSGITEFKTRVSGVKYIGNYAFSDCENLTEIQIINATYIGSFAFSVYVQVIDEEEGDNYGKLIETKTGKLTGHLSLDKATEIGAYAFEYQKGLTGVTMDAVTKIGVYAFSFSGVGIKGAVRMGNVKEIGAGAFYGCENFVGTNGSETTTSLPSSLAKIGEAAFQLTGISRFNVASNNVGGYTSIDGVLFKKLPIGDDKLELVSYPSNPKLAKQNYEIPEGTIRVGARAFMDVTSVKSIVFPSTITHIGDMAFFGCTAVVYTFNSLEAPVLEAKAEGFSKDDSGDSFGYYWAAYANFYSYFSPPGIGYGIITIGQTKKVRVPIFRGQFRYNTITGKYESDKWVYGYYFDTKTYTEISVVGISGANHSVTGGGDMTDENVYGLVLVRPSNGKGYDAFLYHYYFDSNILTAEIAEKSTTEVIDLITGLPETNQITLAERSVLASIRVAYNLLRPAQQSLVTNYSRLTAAEAKMSQLVSAISKFQVSFWVGTKNIDTQTIEVGSKATMPDSTPTDGTKTFLGWYNESGVKFEPEMAITQDMVFMAKFVEGNGEYTVSFSGEGVSVEPQTIAYGEKAVKPADPSRKGYEFKGWYVDGEQYDFNTPIISNITITAEWEKESGCGCGTINFSSFNIGTLIGIITLTAVLGMAVAVLLKKRSVKQ